ncbi:MAG: ribonuclease D [Phototrophicaceae bacterium]|jgi:ribonuclease D
MNNMLPAYVYVDTDAKFRAMLNTIKDSPLLALDTESNGMYAYKERVCLIQLSTRTSDFIIDPFEIKNLQPLGDILNNPQIEKVFHAAEFDLMTLKRDYGFVVQNLFDTMFAARILGYTAFGLGSLLEQFFGVRVDKSHQRDDWGRRPLPQASLRYAQMDTHFLPTLRDQFKAALEQGGRWEEALEIFVEASDVPAAERHFDPEGYWDLGRPSQLTRREFAVLREVYLLRESLAEQEQVPSFKIFTNRLLIHLAQHYPRTLTQLGQVPEISALQVRRFGNAILEAVKRGRLSSLPTPPPLPPPPPAELTERYTLLQQWRKERGIQRGVDSEIILSKAALWRLARQLPTTLDELRQIEGIGPERFRLYGEELLTLIQKFTAPPLDEGTPEDENQ